MTSGYIQVPDQSTSRDEAKLASHGKPKTLAHAADNMSKELLTEILEDVRGKAT